MLPPNTQQITLGSVENFHIEGPPPHVNVLEKCSGCSAREQLEATLCVLDTAHAQTGHEEVEAEHEDVAVPGTLGRKKQQID